MHPTRRTRSSLLPPKGVSNNTRPQKRKAHKKVHTLTPTTRGVSTSLINQFKTPKVKQPHHIDFDDAKNNLAHKTTGELIFSNIILTACRFKPLVQNSEFLIHTGRKLVGDKIVETIIKKTFYKHFCAGENGQQVAKTMHHDYLRGVDHVLDYAAEANEFMDPNHVTEVAPLAPIVPTITQPARSGKTALTLTSHNPQEISPPAKQEPIVIIQDPNAPIEKKSGGCGTGCCGGGCGGGKQFDEDVAKLDALDVFSFDSKPIQKKQSTVTETPSKYSRKEDQLLNTQVAIFQDSIRTLQAAKQNVKEILLSPDLHETHTPNEIEKLTKIASQPSFIAIKLTAIAPIEFLSRTTNALNIHSFLWDSMQGRKTHRLTHNPSVDPLAPENSEKTLFETNPNVLEDLYDTMTREQFTKQIQHYYCMTYEDANELYDQLATRPDREITRYDWQYNINIHHLIALSSKLSHSRIPKAPENAKDLLYAYPALPDKVHDNVFGNTLIDQDDVLYLQKVMKRCDSIMSDAKKANVSVFIDAEQTYYQRFIDHVTMDLMSVYNKAPQAPKMGYNTKQYIDKPLSQALIDQRNEDVSRVLNPTALNNDNGPNTAFPTVWATYQCYTRDAAYRLRSEFEFSKNNDFTFACKIVRGAYMTSELDNCTKYDYQNPVQPSMEHTHNNYNSIMLYLLSQRNASPLPAHILVASHNQESIEIATNYLNAEYEEVKKINPVFKRNQHNVSFGQLRGMLSLLTSALVNKKFSAYTYTPYGTVFEVIPYLLRRSQENSNIFGPSARESKIVNKEILRRMFGAK